MLEQQQLLINGQALESDTEKSLPVFLDNGQGAAASSSRLPKFLRHSLLDRAFLSRILSAVSPSFLNLPGQKSLIGKAHATSYLDGLRGLAAWFVFNTHLSPILSRSMGAGWGHGVESHTFLQLPFVHFVHAGGYPIHIFFIISGLASSFSAIKAMDKSPQDPGSMLQRLSISTFRRPLRLYFPAWASTLIVFLWVRLNLFRAVDAAKDTNIIVGWPLLLDWPQRTGFFAQVYHLIESNLRMLRIISEGTPEGSRGDFNNPYNPVLWTIPIELQGSLLLSLAHVAFFYIPQQRRIALILATMALGLFIGQIFLAVFWSGWLLGEIASVEAKGGTATPTRRMTAVYSLALIFSLYLASYPRYEPEHTAGFQTLAALTPPAIGLTSDFWQGVAAFITIYCCGKLKFAADAMSIPALRYLGRISFAMYLSHFWVVHLLGTTLFGRVWAITGTSNQFATVLGFCISYSILLAIVLWIADLFARYVETPCGKFGQRFQDLVITKVPARS